MNEGPPRYCLRHRQGVARDLPEETHETIATTGSAPDMALLATREDLGRRVFEILADDPDEVVAVMLANNDATPPDLLRRLAERGPEFAGWVGLNANAPVDLVDRSPIGSHIPFTLSRYLAVRGATPEERRRFHDIYEASPHPGAEALAAVWRTVRGHSERPNPPDRPERPG